MSNDYNHNSQLKEALEAYLQKPQETIDQKLTQTLKNILEKLNNTHDKPTVTDAIQKIRDALIKSNASTEDIYYNAIQQKMIDIEAKLSFTQNNIPWRGMYNRHPYNDTRPTPPRNKNYSGVEPEQLNAKTLTNETQPPPPLSITPATNELQPGTVFGTTDATSNIPLQDYRSLIKKIDDQNTRIVQLESENKARAASIMQQPTAKDEEIARLTKTINAANCLLETTIQNNDAQKKEQSNAMQFMQDSFQALRNRLNDIETTLEKQIAALNEKENITSTTMRYMLSKIEDLNRQLIETEESNARNILELSYEKDSLQIKLEKLKTQLELLKEAQEKTQQEVAEAKTTAKQAQTTAEQAQKNAAEAQTTAEQAQGKISSLESKITQVKEENATLEKGVTDLKQQITTLNTSYETQNTVLSKLRQENTNLNTTVNTLNQKVQELEKQLLDAQKKASAKEQPDKDAIQRLEQTIATLQKNQQEDITNLRQQIVDSLLKQDTTLTASQQPSTTTEPSTEQIGSLPNLTSPEPTSSSSPQPAAGAPLTSKKTTTSQKRLSTVEQRFDLLSQHLPNDEDIVTYSLNDKKYTFNQKKVITLLKHPNFEFIEGADSQEKTQATYVKANAQQDQKLQFKDSSTNNVNNILTLLEEISKYNNAQAAVKKSTKESFSPCAVTISASKEDLEQILKRMYPNECNTNSTESSDQFQYVNVAINLEHEAINTLGGNESEIVQLINLHNNLLITTDIQNKLDLLQNISEKMSTPPTQDRYRYKPTL